MLDTDLMQDVILPMEERDSTLTEIKLADEKMRIDQLATLTNHITMGQKIKSLSLTKIKILPGNEACDRTYLQPTEAGLGRQLKYMLKKNNSLENLELTECFSVYSQQTLGKLTRCKKHRLQRLIFNANLVGSPKYKEQFQIDMFHRANHMTVPLEVYDNEGNNLLNARIQEMLRERIATTRRKHNLLLTIFEITQLNWKDKVGNPKKERPDFVARIHNIIYENIYESSIPKYNETITEIKQTMNMIYSGSVFGFLNELVFSRHPDTTYFYKLLHRLFEEKKSSKKIDEQYEQTMTRLIDFAKRALSADEKFESRVAKKLLPLDVEYFGPMQLISGGVRLRAGILS